MVVSRSKSSKNIGSTAPLLNNLSDGMQRNAFCRNLMFYVFMACLLLPIAAFAFWGVQNARPRAVSCWPSSIGQRRYLIGYENDYWFHWVKIFSTELATGETTFRSLGPTQNHPRFGVLGSKIWALAEKSKDHFVLQLADLQDDQIQENCDVQIADQEELERGICVVDHRIIRLRSGKLESTDFLDGSVVDSISFPNQEPSFIDPISDTKNFLVSGVGNPVSKVRETILFRVAEGRIEQLSNWSELHHLQFKVGSAPYVACLLADGLSIEVRNASSGDVVSSYSVPQDPLLTTPLTYIDTTILLTSWFRWRMAPLLYTDALTGQSLPVPPGSELIERDVEGQRLITMRKKENVSLGWDCIVLDAISGKELIRFDIPIRDYSPNLLGGAFLGDSNHLVLSAQDYRIFLYDLSSGKLVRTFDPFVWSDWCNRVAEIAFGIWCLVWLRISARLHSQGWLDMAVCSGFSVGYCGLRIQCIANPIQEYYVCCGIFGSWILAAIYWLIFGKTRWSVRFQPLLLLSGTTIGFMALLLPKFAGNYVEMFSLGLFVLVIMFLLALLPLRYFRFRLEKEPICNEALDSAMKNSGSTIALQDLFLLTIVFAILFSLIRWMPNVNWRNLEAHELISVSLLVCMIAVPSLFACWTALSRRSWVSRWGIWVIAIIGHETLAIGIAGDVFPRELSPSAIVATLFCFYAYRLRGWRLSRPENSSLRSTSC